MSERDRIPEGKNGRITTMNISRSNPEKITCVYPKGHPKYPDGRRVTALEGLRENGRGRSDIFMVLFQRELGGDDWESKQLWVYPSPDGNPNFGEAGEWMTEDEKLWCREENARLLDLAAIHPEYANFLGMSDTFSKKV